MDCEVTGPSTVPASSRSQGDHFLFTSSDVVPSHFSASSQVELCASNISASPGPSSICASDSSGSCGTSCDDIALVLKSTSQSE